jgi:hypothetical protein
MFHKVCSPWCFINTYVHYINGEFLAMRWPDQTPLINKNTPTLGRIMFRHNDCPDTEGTAWWDYQWHMMKPVHLCADPMIKKLNISKVEF